MGEYIRGPELWRKRAEEARVMADQMSDARWQALLIDVADRYELLADVVERTGRPVYLN